MQGSGSQPPQEQYDPYNGKVATGIDMTQFEDSYMQSVRPHENQCKRPLYPRGDTRPLCRCLRPCRCILPRDIWCVRDCCGFVCAVFTWLLIAYSEFVVMRVILLPAPSNIFRIGHFFGYNFFASLAFLSHLKAMFSDPGTVARGNATKENIMRMGFREGQVVYKCPKCSSIKPERAHHCSVCQRCINKMDHHCPWVNNCVGEANQKYFVLFTLYICIISFYSIYLSVHYFLMSYYSDWQESDKSHISPPASALLVLFLIIEGFFFGLFTIAMCFDQIRAIYIDETGIESLKTQERSTVRKSRWVSYEAVFGHPFSWRWLSPLTPPTAPRRDVYMYTV